MSSHVDHDTVAAWMSRSFPHGFRCPTCTSASVAPTRALTNGRWRLACARCGYALSVDMHAPDLLPHSARQQDQASV